MLVRVRDRIGIKLDFAGLQVVALVVLGGLLLGGQMLTYCEDVSN